MDMEGALKEGIYVFKLAELHTTYESHLKTLKITSSINRTRLKRAYGALPRAWNARAI